MSKGFIYSELSRRQGFRLNFKCKIRNISMESVYNEDIPHSGIKIDTGANGLLIPLQTLGWSSVKIEELV